MKSPAIRRSAAAVVAAATAWLAFQAITLGAAMVEADRRPALALAWRREDGPALARTAEQRLAASPRKADALARRALARAPLETGAVRVIGLAAARLGDARQVDAAMAISATRSRRDVPTNLWRFGAALQRADYGEAALDADLLMRVGDRHAVVFPALAIALGDPRAAEPLAARLARTPWRGWFLEDLGVRAVDPGPALRLLIALTSAGAPPTAAEAAPYLNRLVSAGLPRRAYLAWASLLPRGAISALGDLYDGDFQGLPGGPPFNWRLTDGPEGSATLEPRHPRGLQSLHGRTEAAEPVQLAVQMLVLGPGAYRLSGEYAADDAEPATVEWTLACADRSASQLASTALAPDERWRAFSIAFLVPRSGCEAQWLTLEAASGAGRPVGVWFRRFRVVRKPGPT